MTAQEAIRNILKENVEAAGRIARRLSGSLNKLSSFVPVSGHDLEHLDDVKQESLDAFLKRFEQLQDNIENRLFKGIAILENEDVAILSKRDIAIKMEKFRVIISADEWTAISLLRNKLTHDYPGEAEKQAERINEAAKRGKDLLKVNENIKRYALAKGFVNSDKTK